MDDIKLIEVKEEIFSDNKQMADGLRQRLARDKTYLLNIMASPGAGKTSLILKTVDLLKDDFRIGVIEADIDSMVDSKKVAAHGVNAVQIRTGGFCHLDAAMVTKGLNAMDLGGLDLIIIENVGNLVCPAEFDTGAIKNAMILSVPEGDDKPLKYPLMFTVSQALVVNKIDYLSIEDFDIDALRTRALSLNPDLDIFEVSCKTGQGIEEWVDWLRKELETFLA
ncbi:MAG: hydrogenase nickel incorporation protein HypB [Deltaproteobacteria bacterium]|nr:hydrogenase nickel incorporation protein HypB [Deltaproteobacteria bacterium]